MSHHTEYSISRLNDCGCCEGVTDKTPQKIHNRPSLNVIAYRIGKYDDFKVTMLSRLSSSKFLNLDALRTRNDRDFSIALIDAWSIIADVLTFYDQYIANERYLRTATERLSIFELARLIGYKPHPGVAASTLLAFTMDDLSGSPEKVKISIGTKVQSTPKQDEQAQIFETIEAIEARQTWNRIRPRLLKPQIPIKDTKAFLFDGIDTGLKAGDGIVYTPTGGTGGNVFATITATELDQENNRTLVKIASLKQPPIHGSVSTINQITFGLPPPAGNYLGKTFEAAELDAEVIANHFKTEDIFDALSVKIPSSHSVLVFRQVASIFGHNAPAWNSLPDSLIGEVPTLGIINGNLVRTGSKFAPFKFDEEFWPGGDKGKIAKMKLGVCPTGRPDSDPIRVDPSIQPWLFLDNVYKGITPNDNIVLKDGNTWGLYGVTDVSELTKSCFTVTAKVTRLGLDSSERFEDFSIRGTSVFLQSELKPLALIPIEDSIPADNSQTLELNGFVGGLNQDQQVILSDLEIGGSGKLVSEVITLDKIEHELIIGGCTRITFSPALRHVYKRDTVTLNANIALATHGETVQEVLGSGDATQTYQTFILKQPPLTHVSASTPNGVVSTLSIRVNDILWHEADTFFEKGPSERIYIIRTNDAGETIVKFGNGITGARLPTGQNNVRAVYRKGLGTSGLLDAGQLNMLMSRPLGLKETINPHPSTGADDPESYTEAQRNAPLHVLTLERVVSLRDYEDFCRAFGGIAKASAVPAVDSQGKTVLITVAGPNGVRITSDNPVYQNLLQALAVVADPLSRFRVVSHRTVNFRMAGKVKVDPDFIAKKVLSEIDNILRTTFSYDAREFGQPVVLSEVISVMQSIPGVLAVDVDFLYRGKTRKLSPRISAKLPAITSNGQLREAEILILHPGPLDSLEVMS